jgi:hypothetical protein
MKNHDTTDELPPSSMDEFVQVEDLNQEEEGASVLESTIAADESVPPIGQEVQTTVTDLNAEEENVQAMLLQEVISLKEEIKSLKEDVTELKSGTNVAVVKEEANVSCDERIDSGVGIPESDSMRLINILVSYDQAQGVLADQDFFKKNSPSYGRVRKFDITFFITCALEAFQGGRGIQLPTDVLRWPFQRGSEDPDTLYRQLNSDAITDNCLKFQEIVVNHLHLLIGSKPRIEKDAQGELMMFL